VNPVRSKSSEAIAAPLVRISHGVNRQLCVNQLVHNAIITLEW